MKIIRTKLFISDRINIRIECFIGFSEKDYFSSSKSLNLTLPKYVVSLFAFFVPEKFKKSFLLPVSIDMISQTF